ncbi:hypothetical protein QQS21_005414 [Conoideocrella luteorostrata]|uniref:Uncharacterized protein n=1 Tax=Conoideocrella luteorostrata TaxID=1105319 RepID=A0AAJ0G0Z0_9HYPO|nr:hypothetical protein QQS21_005414 [Conoideocrella luteorostrata]
MNTESSPATPAPALQPALPLDMGFTQMDPNTPPSSPEYVPNICQQLEMVEYCRVLAETRRIECNQLREIIRELEMKIQSIMKRQTQHHMMFERQRISKRNM